MPATSKSQQHLFGMVHAYQKGQMKNPPSKIKNVAKHISATDATHFAATKTSKLPNHVKKAALLDYVRAIKHEDFDHYLKTEQHDAAAQFLRRRANTHPDYKDRLDEHKQLSEMNKQAHDLGFVKAAIDQGFSPLQAVN